MRTPKPCQVDGCDIQKARGRHRCIWHWLLAQPIEVQERAAAFRLAEVAEADHRARVPEKEWPEGHRWCSGCQHFVPLFYARGSRCVACSSRAAHRGHVKRQFAITAVDYEALLAAQKGRCALCRRVPRSRRLAVDHDHVTGRVRGLLCSDSERGCNHVVVGIIESASVDGGLEMARRIVDYLEHPPYDELRASQHTLCPNCGRFLEVGKACDWCAFVKT